MVNEFKIPVSVEKLAAYMDGNLTPEEVHDVSMLIENDPVLSEIMSVSQNVDNQLHLPLADDFMLPDELNSPDFDIPIASIMSGIPDADQSLDFLNTHQDYSTLNYENDSYVPDTSMGDDVTIFDLNI